MRSTGGQRINWKYILSFLSHGAHCGPRRYLHYLNVRSNKLQVVSASMPRSQKTPFSPQYEHVTARIAMSKTTDIVSGYIYNRHSLWLYLHALIHFSRYTSTTPRASCLKFRKVLSFIIDPTFCTWYRSCFFLFLFCFADKSRPVQPKVTINYF